MRPETFGVMSSGGDGSIMEVGDVLPGEDGLNIVIFACVDYPEGPATTSRVKLLSKILTGAGHHVYLAVFNANARTPIPENRLVRGAHDSVEYVYLSGKTVRPARLLDALSDTLKGIVGSVIYLRNMRQAGRADLALFYTPDIFRVFPSLLLSRAYGVPILLELCEIFSSDRRKRGIKQAFKLMGAGVSDRVLPAMSSGVMAISTKIVEFLKQRGLSDERIMHLPILVDCGRFSTPSRTPVQCLAKKRYFLNSGALDGKEGLEFVLEAFAKVFRKHDPLYLALTGAPDTGRKAFILDLAGKLGVERGLVFTGFLPADELAWAYQNAVALICCRADTAFANYGFPTKLAEYLCSGRPVITNEVGDTGLYLKEGETAYFARAEDVRSISSAMDRVLDSPGRAAEIGLNGREVARRNFDYSIFIRPLDAFIRGVAGNGFGEKNP